MYSHIRRPIYEHGISNAIFKILVKQIKAVINCDDMNIQIDMTFLCKYYANSFTETSIVQMEWSLVLLIGGGLSCIKYITNMTNMI